MKLMVSSVILALVAIHLVQASQEHQPQVVSGQHQPAAQHQPLQNHQQQQQPQHHQQQVVSSERQGRSIGNGGNSNVIEHTSSKSRIEAEKRQVQEFLTTKNIFKSLIKLLFGNQDEISATSRNVLGIMTKMLDLLKNTFGQKSRGAGGRTIRDHAEDVANAGVSILQGYVKSMLAQDDKCVQRYLCQASKEATRDGRDLGYVIATVGGYASSYLLDGSKSTSFKSLHDASTKGRSMEDCAKLYAECNEQY